MTIYTYCDVNEQRFDLKSIHSIDINKSSFAGKLLLYIRVKMKHLFKSSGERIPNPGNNHYIEDGGLKIGEWTPWLEISGDLESKWHWVREDVERDCLVFAYEIVGTFPLGTSGNGLYYPFDYHELEISFTSNWDCKHLIFIPWDSNWSMSSAKASLTATTKFVDPCASRARKQDILNTLKNKWTFTTTPMLNFTSSSGMTQYTYSEVRGSIFVQRCSLVPVVYEVLRPFVLGILTPSSLSFFGTDPQTRLQFNVSVLVAMSLAFVRATGERITMADMFRLSMFCVAAAILILDAFFSSELKESTLRLVTWIIFLAVCAVFILGILFIIWPSGLLRRRQHNSKSSSGGGNTLTIKTDHGQIEPDGMDEE